MSRNWYRLDTAALIFPAVMKKNWSNAFRLSAELTEAVDVPVLQQAVEELRRRFPSFYVRLRTGAFWYYLEELTEAPKVRQEFAYPLTHMSRKELRQCCLRVFAYKNRIAVEFFHSLTDGTGGSIYLRTLLARYILLKYGVPVTDTPGTLRMEDSPSAEELEDSFLKNSAGFGMSRREPRAYRLGGHREKDGYLHLTTGIVPTRQLIDLAHSYHCTVTVFLSAVMAECIGRMQASRRPLRRQKPVKITVPVNLRRLYGSHTLRNFALTLNPGIDPKNGSFTLQELCSVISHQLAAEAIPQNMAGRIAANVLPQQLLPLRLAPLFLKNLVMGFVYRNSGECFGCLNISNLGALQVPPELERYVSRVDFIIGVQRSYPNNCSVASYRDKTYINMIRNIKESELERHFFSRLVELGLPVSVESNER